jgi:TatA/E family protein of Tat protein translocase
MFGLGTPELIFIGALALLLFGGSQLPKLGRSVGSFIRELRGAGRELTKGIEDETEEK